MLKLKHFFSLFFLLPSLTIAQSYVVYDFTHNQVLEGRGRNDVRPIASVTKLMTANVFLEHNRNPNCTASITEKDADYIKGTSTKLPRHTPIACSELLKAMLVHSDNFAAHALARSAGMNRSQFIHLMNKKAKELGMHSTRFIDSSGLSSLNVSSPMDLVKLAQHSLSKPQIQALSDMAGVYIHTGRRKVFMRNTNQLVRDKLFSAAVNKTGYIRESGYNLVFLNKGRCRNNAMIGVISLNNSSSASRSQFTQGKLQKYGCGSANRYGVNDSANDTLYAENYDEVGMEQLIQNMSQ